MDLDRKHLPTIDMVSIIHWNDEAFCGILWPIISVHFPFNGCSTCPASLVRSLRSGAVFFGLRQSFQPWHCSTPCVWGWPKWYWERWVRSNLEDHWMIFKMCQVSSFAFFPDVVVTVLLCYRHSYFTRVCNPKIQYIVYCVYKCIETWQWRSWKRGNSQR